MGEQVITVPVKDRAFKVDRPHLSRPRDGRPHTRTDGHQGSGGVESHPQLTRTEKPVLAHSAVVFDASPRAYLNGAQVAPDTDLDPLETDHSAHFYQYERLTLAANVVTRPSVEAERIARMQGKRANPVTGYRTR